MEEEVIYEVNEIVEEVAPVLDTTNIELLLQNIYTQQQLTNTILLWTVGVVSAVCVLFLLYKFIRLFY